MHLVWKVAKYTAAQCNIKLTKTTYEHIQIATLNNKQPIVFSDTYEVMNLISINIKSFKNYNHITYINNVPLDNLTKNILNNLKDIIKNRTYCSLEDLCGFKIPSWDDEATNLLITIQTQYAIFEMVEINSYLRSNLTHGVFITI